MQSERIQTSNNSQGRDTAGTQNVSRRSIAAGGLAALVVPRHVLGGSGYQAPSDTLTIACVGVAGMGKNYLEGCKGERVVALCDLDHEYATPVFNTYPDARRYHDFRKMLDKEVDNFDSLIIATPDHWHALLMQEGLKHEKHVYCAKPITHTVGEARKVRAAFQNATNLITKSSIQDSATSYARATTELLTSGAIGPVREVHIWTNTICPCSMERPAEVQTPPPGMDWDMWLGPAPKRPFHSTYHPLNWRPWWDFGNATVGDFGCHTLHMYFDELKMGAPARISASSSSRPTGFFKYMDTNECESHASVIAWDFPARDGLPEMRVFFYAGGIKPHRPMELDDHLPMPRGGVLFVGEQGKQMSGFYGGNPYQPFGRDRGGPKAGLPGGLLLPQSKFKDVKQPEPTLRRVEKADHYKEWTQGCKTGTPTVVPIEFGAKLTEMALLGAVALRSGKLLKWDAKTMKVTNDAEANKLIDPPYENGWSLEL
jgi:GFO/IDH/MocA oxidoreductase family protein